MGMKKMILMGVLLFSFPVLWTNPVFGADPLPADFPAVTIDTVPSGLTVTVDGIACTAPAVFNWMPGSSHSLDTARITIINRWAIWFAPRS
jgi:hypothetical protein